MVRRLVVTTCNGQRAGRVGLVAPVLYLLKSSDTESVIVSRGAESSTVPATFLMT